MLNKESVIRLIKGKFNSKELIVVWSASLFTIILLILISYILYPPDLNYSIITDTISYLGDYIRNPTGWYFLSIAFIIAGITWSYLIIYIHRRIVLILPWFARIGTISLLIGCIGIFLTGITPDVYGSDFIEDLSYGKLHNVVAMFAMFGILIGLTIYGILFIIDHYPRFQHNSYELYPDFRTLPFFLLLAGAGIFMLMTVISLELFDYPWPGPGIFSFPLWEWFMTITYLINIYWLSLKVPNCIPNLEKNGK